MGKDSYMDGFKYDVPAEKLGYIQKLGAGRMAPGKKGDLTAMKMMHGDAAAKYYDGAGKHMNGAPKYEGASKGMHSPMKHIDPNNPNKGHEVGSDRPSYTETKTKQVVVPGTSSSTDTSSSGGGTSSTANYDKLMSTKKDLGPDFKPTKEQTAKANEEVRIAREKDKAASTKKSSTKKSTAPSVKTEVVKEKKTSKVEGKGEQDLSNKEIEKNRINRYKAGRDERINIAKKDSANVAQAYLKNKPLTKKNIFNATRLGDRQGFYSLVGDGTDDRGKGRGSFGEKKGEFRFDRDEAKELFNPTVGSRTIEVTEGSYKRPQGKTKFKKGDKFASTTRSYQDQVGKEIKLGKKGKGKVTNVQGTGSEGSFGGYDTAQEYMDAMGMSAGSPKLPSGPMKFGMNSSKHSK